MSQNYVSKGNMRFYAWNFNDKVLVTQNKTCHAAKQPFVQKVFYEICLLHKTCKHKPSKHIKHSPLERNRSAIIRQYKSSALLDCSFAYFNTEQPV